MSLRAAPRLALVAACILPLAALLPVSARQDPPATQEETRTWTENSEFTLELDGQPVPEARLYNARGRAAVLLILPGREQAFVIDTEQRQVLRADTAAIRPSADGGAMTLDDSAIGGEPAPFTLDKETVIFFQAGKRYRLSRRPPLLGPVTAEALVAQMPAYRKGMEEYTPAPQDIFYLKGFADPIRIEVYFGSWCPHCRNLVPKFLKSIREAGNANLQCVYTGLPSPFADYPPAKEKQVRGVPTFIIYAGDQEIGRIAAFAADSSVEHELVKILYQWKQSRG